MANTVSRTISDETLSRIIQIESGGKPNAKAGTSSARGLGQFLNATWLAELQQYRPDLFNGPPYDDELALRNDPSISIELLARFTEENARTLGAGYTDGDLYLAHFSGAKVARKLIRAKQDASAATCYDAAAIAANKSILEGKTVGEVRAWAARRMAASGATNWVRKYWTGSAQPAQATTKLSESNIVKGAATAATAVTPPLAGAAIKVATDDTPDVAPTVVEKVTNVVDRGGDLISTSKTIVDAVPPPPKGFWHLLAGILTDPIVVCVFGALALGAIAYVVIERRRKLRQEGV